jgi:hypothetical protein
VKLFGTQPTKRYGRLDNMVQSILVVEFIGLSARKTFSNILAGVIYRAPYFCRKSKINVCAGQKNAQNGFHIGEMVF